MDEHEKKLVNYKWWSLIRSVIKFRFRIVAFECSFQCKLFIIEAINSLSTLHTHTHSLTPGFTCCTNCISFSLRSHQVYRLAFGHLYPVSSTKRLIYCFSFYLQKKEFQQSTSQQEQNIKLGQSMHLPSEWMLICRTAFFDNENTGQKQ